MLAQRGIYCCVTQNVEPKRLISRQSPSEMSFSKIKRLRKKIKEKGFDLNEPIEVADAEDRLIILDGHHRVQAAIGARLKEVPARIYETTKEETQLLLNQAAEAKLYQ